MEPQLKMAFMAGALFLGFLIADSSIAATYHVKKSGNDSHSCTQAQSASTPKLTISSALNCIGTGAGAGANHTVRVYAGTYAEIINNNLPGGTSWNDPFTLESNPGDDVTISPSTTGVIFLIQRATRFAILKGITIDGARGENDCLKITPSSKGLGTPEYIRVIDSEIRNCAKNGVLITTNANNNQFIRVRVHHVGRGGTGHGFYIQSSNNLIEASKIYKNYKKGIQLYDTEVNNVNNNIMRYNLIFENAVGDLNDGQSGIVVNKGSGNQIYGNVVLRNGDGITLGYTKNAVIYNNTVHGNRNVGIDVKEGASGTVVKNNISYQNRVNIQNIGTGTVQANNLTADPKFVGPTTDNFRLQAGSPAIDKGVSLVDVKMDIDGILRPQGSAYDIGAHEYRSTSSTTSTSSVPAAPGNLVTTQ